MIFYFSATGNCKYVASRISSASNEELIPIAGCIKEKKFGFSISAGQAVGIISPTYAWGLPIIVCDFLEQMKLDFAGSPYIYFIATYGTTPGQTGYFTNQYLERKGLSLNARFSVKMPDTWTPTYDLSRPEKISAINKQAEPQIDFIIQKIEARDSGDFIRHKVPIFAAKFFYKTEYDSMRQTRHFWVEDACVCCGLCVNGCPANAMEMQGGKPIWTKSKCIMCLGCLHRCPKFAIQYGKNTKRHGQYKNPNVSM